MYIICLNCFLLEFRKMQDISSIGRFYKNEGFYLEGVWLLRISGSYSQEMMGIIQIKDSSKVPIFIWESMGIFEVSESLGTVLLGSDQYH